MSERSVQHGSFTIRRRYDAPPARVFAAWADPAARLIWGAPGEGWELAEPRFDFRIGGIETSRFGPAGDPVYRNETRYADIVPDRRIVFSYSMTSRGTPISVSLTTVEISPGSEGTRLLLTEQVVFLDGNDNAANREEGLASMLDKIGESLAA